VGRRRRELLERALLAAKLGRWQEALDANRELAAMAPGVAEIHNRIGKALSELGRHQEAFAAYQTASEIEPHNTIASRNLKRLEVLKEITDAPTPGHPLVRSHVFIEETGKTASVSLVTPTSKEERARMMPGDPVELRIDTLARRVEVYSLDGVRLGEIEPRIATRLADMYQAGNRYTAAILHHEEDTLRVILREIYQDPNISDRLSFPSRVRGTAPRAYIRKDILFDSDDADLLVGDDDDEAEADEAEEEAEIEDEEFHDDEDELDSSI
jgi:tetratricopeptide (TPR) repeat protein